MSAVRELALSCLEQKKSTVPFPQILEQAYAKLAPAADHAREKAFLMALCYGVMRHAGLLKQLFLPYCRKKPDSVFEHCLCLALYEFFFLHKEAYSCVNEYVAVLKKAQNRQSANALNAILRAMAKDEAGLRAKLANLEQTVRTKIPANQIPGKKALRRLHELADLPPLFTQELDKPFVQLAAEESFCAPLPAYRLNARRPLSVLPADSLRLSGTLIANGNAGSCAEAENQGFLSRQGVCSALLTEKIADFLQKNHAEPVAFWDMCCGRGGKSLGLLEKGINITMVTEPNQARLAEFGRQLLRLNLPYMLCGTDQLTDTAKHLTPPDNSRMPIEAYADLAQNAVRKARQQIFDCILLDSPCSTSGTAARNPEVKYRISPESLQEILRTQQELLALARSHLKDGGLLFYCTCSVFFRENKGQIKTFLDTFGDMRLLCEEYLTASRLDPILAGHDILYFAVLLKSPHKRA